MASNQVEVQGSDIRLKHLGFVRILTINAVVLVSNIYDQAKQHSGSLKSTVDGVEKAVTTAVGPVYQSLKGVSSHLLIFLDDKEFGETAVLKKQVDLASHKFEECAPPTAKKVAFHVHLFMKKASQTIQELAEEAKVGGPLAAVSRAGKISEHFAVSQLAFIWYKVNQHPSLRGVSNVALSTATYCSEKFNNSVKEMRSKGYNVFNYVPLVPTEEMARAYEEIEAGERKKTDASSSSGSDSDKE